MAYIIFNSDGEEVAGDALLDEMMVQAADEVGGYIEDSETHERVYDSKKGS